MSIIDMTKKSNYLAAQGKEDKAQCDLVEVFTEDEIEKIRAEAFKKFDNGKPVYQQAQKRDKQARYTTERQCNRNDKKPSR